MSVRANAWKSLAAVGLLLAGCTTAPAAPGSSASASGTPTPPMISVTVPTMQLTPATLTPSPTEASPATPTLGSVVSPPASPQLPPSAAPRVPSLVSAPPGSTVTLDLATAFHADGWVVGDHVPAATLTHTSAAAATINCNQAPVEVEYRLMPTRGTIRVTVAQDVLSSSSGNTVDFQIVADGTAVAEANVVFKQKAELTAPLTDVVVVKITAQSKGTCRTSSTALILSATIQG